LVKDGDLFFFRIKVVDNRHVPRGAFRDAEDKATPATDLGPQSVYFPAPAKEQPRWFMLRADGRVQPLEMREILAQQGAADQQLDALKKKIIQAREKLLQLEQTSRFQPELSDTQADELAGLEKRNDHLRDDLMDLAKQAAKTPELAEIGDKARDAAQTE